MFPASWGHPHVTNSAQAAQNRNPPRTYIACTYNTTSQEAGLNCVSAHFSPAKKQKSISMWLGTTKHTRGRACCKQPVMPQIDCSVDHRHYIHCGNREQGIEWGKTPPLSYLTHYRSVFTGAGMYRCPWNIHLKLYKLASTGIDNSVLFISGNEKYNLIIRGVLPHSWDNRPSAMG